MRGVACTRGESGRGATAKLVNGITKWKVRTELISVWTPGHMLKPSKTSRRGRGETRVYMRETSVRVQAVQNQKIKLKKTTLSY